MHALHALVIIFEHWFKLVKDNVKWYRNSVALVSMFIIVFCALHMLLSIVNELELSVHRLLPV